MALTRLKKLKINFRALRDVEIELGDAITVICGKNGTSKSSILGVAAQMFSFEKDYVRNVSLPYAKITGGDFKSRYKEHIRISDKFDRPGSMSVAIELEDGYTGRTATGKLELMAREGKPRPVIRHNSVAQGNQSRNFTHPVIFLSLKRLYPIADRDYNTVDNQYLTEHRSTFIQLSNELLNRTSAQVTGTRGTISSAVAHDSNYDHESVSAGEDNAGQIVLALMSFRKLKNDYPDYKGGLLLIDEADAGLFPTAQINLIKILERECRELNLQVVMTSHSPTLIQYAYDKGQEFRRRYKTVYLSDSFGAVQVMNDWSWTQIYADIHSTTVTVSSDVKLPKVNVYFEDAEASDFISVLLNRQPIKRFVKLMTDVSLGCTNYLQLIDHRVPEFEKLSVVCLDADVVIKTTKKSRPTVVILPGQLPPDQLIFEYLYNLPASHPFWTNEIQFTRSVFTREAAEVIREFGVSGEQVNLKNLLETQQWRSKDGKTKVREIFKRFYKMAQVQRLVKVASKPYNPWRLWIANHPEACNQFLESFKQAVVTIMKNGYAVEADKLTALQVTFKKVS
jgi:predicted ATPase